MVRLITQRGINNMIIERLKRKYSYIKNRISYSDVPEKRDLPLSSYLAELDAEQLHDIVWPNSAQVAVTYSYDDISLRDGKFGTADCGGDVEGVAWYLFYKLKNAFPELRHSFFLSQGRCIRTKMSLV